MFRAFDRTKQGSVQYWEFVRGFGCETDGTPLYGGAGSTPPPSPPPTGISPQPEHKRKAVAEREWQAHAASEQARHTAEGAQREEPRHRLPAVT